MVSLGEGFGVGFRGVVGGGFMEKQVFFHKSDPKKVMTHQNPKKGTQKNKANKEMGRFWSPLLGLIF